MKLLASKLEKVISHRYHPFGAGVMAEDDAPPPRVPSVPFDRLKLAKTLNAVLIAS
jgi:hypothetical protein